MTPGAGLRKIGSRFPFARKNNSGVQGGTGNKSSQQRVIIDSEGNVYISKKIEIWYLDEDDTLLFVKELNQMNAQLLY